MRNYSTLPSLLLLQQHNSGDEPSHLFPVGEGLENHPGSAFSSGFFWPMMNQCSASNVEEDTHFGQPFQSDLLGDSRKRPLEDFVPRDGLFSNTPFPVKRKAIAKPMNAVLKAPAARRSQKLSDKITSLQKVVSPYGKTDTASVLQEACTYIKIAHQEIRRLSVSYFGGRPIHPQVLMHGYPDLRSKGLSLVPLWMTSQFSVEDSGDGSNSNQGINSWGF